MFGLAFQIFGWRYYHNPSQFATLKALSKIYNKPTKAKASQGVTCTITSASTIDAPNPIRKALRHLYAGDRHDPGG